MLVRVRWGLRSGLSPGCRFPGARPANAPGQAVGLGGWSMSGDLVAESRSSAGKPGSAELHRGGDLE